MRALLMSILVVAIFNACDGGSGGDGGGGKPDADTNPGWDSWKPPTGEDVVVPPGVDTISSGNITIELQLQDEIMSGYSEIVAVVDSEFPPMGVEFYVDQVRIDTDLIPPYDLMLNTALYEDGAHQLSVYTANEVGGYASATVTAMFDNTAPAFTSLEPPEGQGLFFEDGPLHMALTVADVNPLDAVEFRVNGLLVADFPAPPYAGDIPWETVYVDEASLPKNLFLQFYAKDFLGLVTESEFNATVHRRLAWSVPTLGEIWATAGLLPDGNLVFGNLNSKVTCVTPGGAPVWDLDLPGGVSVAPAVEPSTGKIFVGALDGKVYGLSSAGAQIWTQDMLSPPGGGLVVSGSQVIVATYDGKVRALATSNGSEAWSVQLPGLISSSPAVASDGTVYIGTQDSKLYAIKSGTVQWTHPTGGEIWSTPAVGPDGTIYVGSNDGWLYAVTAAGVAQWTIEIKGQIWGQPLVGLDGAVYVGSTSKYLTRVEASSGTIEWTTKLDGLSYSSPVMDTEGAIYIGTTAGRFYGVDAEAGEILWSYAVGDSIHATPVLTPDCAVFGSTDRSIYCVRTRAPVE
ncbi:MAG: PQQ-binding-like beta-propeller repeat protein [Pseudomonadota bacterium]